ncbi:MAG: hypothetical protein CM15mP100_1050 [Alphaproteobacteria bacterium]|nr:MAG: hypothetical protein CM15mP100_1050 [Alphaproteobacteria bacterium]
MDKLGLLERPTLELTETAQPLYPARWGRLSSYTISFGHGISVSPIHVAGAVSAAAGTGEFIAPTLLKRRPDELFERVRIFSDETTRKVRSMMRLAVSHEDGTAILLKHLAIWLAQRQEPPKKLKTNVMIKQQIWFQW